MYLHFSSFNPYEKHNGAYIFWGILYLIVAFLNLYYVFETADNLINCDLEINLEIDKTSNLFTLSNENIGTNFLIDGENAPDGEHKYKNGKDIAIIIKDGIVIGFVD
jgi:hypothetical protein